MRGKPPQNLRLKNKKLQGEQLEAELDRIYARAGRRLRIAAFRLKGIIVKIGQFLSMREDLLPLAFTGQLTELQDAMPAASFGSVLPAIEHELKQNIQAVFKSFDEKALAAASLAQVHRAVLLDGTVVAVKVLRPGMEKLAQADLDSLGLWNWPPQERVVPISPTCGLVQFTRKGWTIHIYDTG